MELIEEPIVLTEENDYLGTLKKANAITEFIELNTELLEKNNMLSIYGEWGSGKSSMMKTIYNSLPDDNYKKIWIDMWKEESDYSNLSIKIINLVLKNIGVNQSARKEIIKGFLNLGKGIKINVPHVSYDMDKIMSFIEKMMSDSNDTQKFIESFQKKIENYIKENNKKIIVFLDDLDRCNSENMLNIIYNIKLLLSVKNVIFIFGIDKEAVSLALKNKYNNEINKAESFLDKIFPIAFSVPKNSFDFEKLLKIYFKDLEEEKLKTIKDFFSEICFYNPRKIKKVLLRYSIIKKNLIEKNKLDESNEWNIIWVLFFIIENEFEESNYSMMISNNKKAKFCSLIKFEQGNLNLRKVPGYNEYELSTYIEEDSGTAYLKMELFEFILNPGELSRNTVPIHGITSKIGVVFNSNTWFDLFKDSLSKRFCLFFFKNCRVCIQLFGGDLTKFLEARYNLIQEIDKLV